MWHLHTISFLLFLSFLTDNCSALTRIDPLVESKLGLIRGLRASDGDYSMFLGIPYAVINESNPFGLSIPHTGFDDAFEAYEDAPMCPQSQEFGSDITGSLDCLRLNIYVPNRASSGNRLPVMVWIHGGAFRTGSARREFYGPRFLVEKDIILVTLNYRLGAYGFMCLDTPDIPGNQGLKDQLQALRWVKDNIESFGGDDNQITLFGESAGGVSVDFHLIYNQENLFNKVIMQSGVALCPWTVSEPDTLAPIKIAENLGLPTTDINEALKFLASNDPLLVIASANELGLAFDPCVEKDFDGIDKFIYDYPVNIQELKYRNTPMLLGYNSEESLGVYGLLAPEDFAALNPFYDTLKEYLNLPHENLVEMEAELRQFYIGDEKISKEVRNSLTRFDSDFVFNHPTLRTINKYLNSGSTNIYYYIFFYEGGRNYAKLAMNITAPGVMHSDELPYFFDVSDMSENISPEDQLIIDRVTTMWTNFVKYGNPTPEITELLPIQWPVTTRDQLYYMYIGTELSVQKRNFQERMAMWNLFYKLNEKYQLGYREN